MKLLVTVDNNKSMNDKLKENDDIINASQSHKNDTFHSLYITPASAVSAVSISQDLITVIDDQFVSFAATSLMKYSLNNSEMSLQITEVTDNKQK